MNTIEINGKELPFRFSFIAIRKFSKLTGLGMDQLGQMGADHILEMLYAGLYGGCRKNKVDFDLTIEDLEIWLDDNFHKLESIMEMVAADMTGEESGK